MREGMSVWCRADIRKGETQMMCKEVRRNTSMTKELASTVSSIVEKTSGTTLSDPDEVSS